MKKKLFLTIFLLNISNNYSAAILQPNKYCENNQIEERNLFLKLLEESFNRNNFPGIKKAATELLKDKNGDFDIIQFFLRSIVQNNIPLVQIFLDSGADIHYKFKTGSLTPFQLAQKIGNTKIIELFQNKIQENRKETATQKGKNSEIENAIVNNDLNEVKHLIDNGAEVNTYKNIIRTDTPLIYQAKTPEMIKLLINNNADLDYIPHPFSNTALGLAILNNDIEKIKLLLNAGADLNKVSEIESEGDAINLASTYEKDKEIIKLLELELKKRITSRKEKLKNIISNILPKDLAKIVAEYATKEDETSIDRRYEEKLQQEQMLKNRKEVVHKLLEKKLGNVPADLIEEFSDEQFENIPASERI